MSDDDPRCADLVGKIEAHLAALTPSIDPDDIARALRRRGIKGRREKPCDCPFARYVQQILPPGLVAFVNERVEIFESPKLVSDLEYYVPLTTINLAQHYVDFIYEFDAGSYPELIDLAA